MFLDEERKLAEAFASRLGVIIEKIRDEERIRELSSRLIESQENERRRVACDLHDGPIQTMLVSKINIAEFIKVEKRSNPLLERGLQLMDRALSDLREVCDDLYPSVLEDIGISAAINRYCENYLEPNGIEVIKKFSVPSDCSSHYQENLYRISQELLSNVMKHSGADTVYYTLRLTRDAGGTGIYLEVTDNGLGSDIAEPAGHGTGLRSVQFRAEALDCRFHVISEEGRGTRAIVTSRKDYVPDKGLYSG
jgi:signal transduction histidine kinase